MIGLAALLGCAGLGAAPPPPPPPPLEAPPAPPPKRTTLPPGPFDATEAWLGVVVDGSPWSPRDGGTLVVPAPTGWDEVEEGATFAGLSADGPVALAFQGVRDVSWGCGAAVSAATFTASPAPSSGVVWIVQEAGNSSAVRPKDLRPPSSSRRLYRLPFGGELDLQPGRSVVELGGARPFVDTWPKPAGLDLGRDGAIGPTWPELAVTEGEETLLLVLRRNGVDEVGWDVVRIAGRRGTVSGSVKVAYGACGG